MGTGNARRDEGPTAVWLIALFTAPMFLVGLTLLVFFFVRMDSLAQKGVERRAKSIVGLLSRSLSPGLAFDDRRFVRDMLERVQSEFIYAVVFREDGSVLAGLRVESAPKLPAKAWSREPAVLLRSNQLDVVVAIDVSGGTAGALQAGLSLAELKRERKTNLLVVGSASGCVLLVGLAFSVLGVSYLRRRRRAESALTRSEASFRTLIESLPDGVAVLRDGQLVYASPQARLFLCPKTNTVELLAGRHLLDFVHPDDRDQVRSALAPQDRGELNLGEVRFCRDDGEVLTADVTCLSLVFDGELACVLIIDDITDRKQMQARILTTDRMASVGTLAAGVAHEINNPLAYVLTNLFFALEQLRALASQAQQGKGVDANVLEETIIALAESYEGAQRVRRIVKDLRTFSRGEDDTVYPVDLHKVVESCASMAWNEIKHRATLVKSLGEVPHVLGNESRLGQVVMNLLVNAAQAIPVGAVSSNRITIATHTAPDGRAVLEVTDTGCGMSPYVLKRIFDPFFTTKAVGEGTGLGLAICESIITAMHGEIGVQSQVGQGTTFRLLLPATERSTARAESAASDGGSGRRLRIMVVDDEPWIGSSVQRILGGKHDVTVITDPRDALSRLVSGDPVDIVLCDLMMPNMSGMELYDEISRRVPGVADRIIFVTGGGMGGAAREFFERVRNLTLAKPFSPERLRQIVGEWPVPSGSPS